MSVSGARGARARSTTEPQGPARVPGDRAPRPTAPPRDRHAATDAVAPDQLGLMLQLKAVEHAAIETAANGSRTAAPRAPALHPLVDSVRIAERILDAAGGG